MKSVVLVGAVAAGLAASLLSPLQLPAAPAAKAGTAADGPATTPTAPAATDKKTTMLNYLERDAYGKKLTAPFWLSRAMAVISLAKLPTATSTTRLMDVMDKDKDNVVRLLAWEAILSRAPDLDAKTHQRWINSTLTLCDKDAFHGSLRIAVLDVLATAPPSAKAKRLWQQIFTDTNAWEPQDIPTLEALGRSLAAWKSSALVEAMVKAMTDPNACVRAEYVLRAAGCDSTSARDDLKPEIFNPQSPTRTHPSSTDLWKKVQADAYNWYQKNRANWKEQTKVDGEPWKTLTPLYIKSPVPLDQFDPDDKAWTADLELGRADLDQFEAVFVVDATGSMGDVLAWLRRDMARVMSAFNLVCKESPRLGVVFYRDRDQGDAFVTKDLPMTYKLADLAPGLMSMTADGGGDIPEAVLDGLSDAVEKMAWSKSKRTGKIMILVGDAPPKPGSEAKCNAMAKKGADAGIKTYACKITTVDGKNDLSTFDDIAAAGHGSSVAADFGKINNVRFLGPDQKEIPIQTIARPEAQLIVAPTSADQPPGEKILVHILSDMISPEYKDRTEPLAQTLLAYVQVKSDAEKRMAFPANTPPLVKGNFNPQKK